MTVAITPPTKSPALVSISAAVPLDLNSCRREIERAATIKVTPNTSTLSIRECLLSVGLSPCQASNRTMQARVRREVKHLLSGSTRKIPWGEKSRPPGEIIIRTTIVSSSTATATTDRTQRQPGMEDDEFDSKVNELFQEVDDISVLSEPTCFLPQNQEKQQQQQQQQHLVLSQQQKLILSHSVPLAGALDPLLTREVRPIMQQQRSPPISVLLSNTILQQPRNDPNSGITDRKELAHDFALEAANKWLEAEAMV